MLNKSKIISFVATSNANIARKFYEETLGLTFLYEDQFAIVFEDNGMMLRIQIVDNLDPAGHTVLGWQVSDIKKSIEALTMKGVKFNKYVGLDQDDDGIWIAPTKAKIAWFNDPDKNTLSLTQF